MKKNVFTCKTNLLPALPPLLALIWHSCYTIFYSHPHYLLFLCYSANLLLAVGILLGSELLVGVSFGWILIAFPLWLYNAVLNSEWVPSSIAFHLSGLAAGACVIKNYRLPKYTWCAALGLGLFLQTISRRYTDESLNVNAAFRIYEGWEGLFPSYTIFKIIMFAGFGSFFILLTWFNNRFLYQKPERH